MVRPRKMNLEPITTITIPIRLALEIKKIKNHRENMGDTVSRLLGEFNKKDIQIQDLNDALEFERMRIDLQKKEMIKKDQLIDEMKQVIEALKADKRNMEVHVKNG